MAVAPCSDINEALAGNLIDKYISTDQKFFDLSGLLWIKSDKETCVSGQSDIDYPSLSTAFPALKTMPFISDVNHVPIPKEVLHEFENMQCNSNMGLMSLIKRAWVTIDSTIYLWNYENGSDLAYFDGLNEIILSVGLVLPKVGVFKDHIHYLLVLTTPTEIIILGVSFVASSSDPLCELHLIPEPLFCLPSDNVSMISILGSYTGRIFMGGKDGNLYEFFYQLEDGWFTRRCKKINHSFSMFSLFLPSFLSFSEEDPLVQIIEDGLRNILYTRSESGTIKVYDLGADGMGLSNVSYITLETVIYKSCRALKIADKSLFDTLIHISVIPPSESSTLHLLACTKSGVRLYFTTTPDGVPLRPSLISLVHVRLPPGFCPSNAASRPGNSVHRAFYRRGCMLFASSQSEYRDMFWLIDPDSFPFHNNLVEAFVTHPLNGCTWAMAESIETGELEATESFVTLPPAVVTQHTLSQRKFVLLTTHGSYIITKLRPVDQLRHLLNESHSAQSESVEAFFYLHGSTQACAMCLILATGPNREVAHLAMEAYFKYGGEPHFIFPTAVGSSSLPMNGNNYQTSFQTSGSAFARVPVSQMSGISGNSLGGPVIGPEVQLSSKHEGLSLYLARLLRPLWNVNMTNQIMECGNNSIKIVSSYSLMELTILGEQLLELKAFLDKHNQFFPANATEQSQRSPSNVHQKMLNFMRPEGMATDTQGHVHQSLLNKYKSDAYLMEHYSLQCLYSLINKCCESLSLWKLLCEYEFEATASHLSNEDKLLLKQFSFKKFVLEEKQLSASLISCLLARFSGDVSRINTLISHLRHHCHSLFSQEDEIASKANERVVVAVTLLSPTERQSALNDSLKLYSQVTEKINLQTVFEQYKTLHFYEGIIELTLCSAHREDPQNLALHFYKIGQLLTDCRGQEALSKRRAIYGVLTQMLEQLLQEVKIISSPPIPIKPGSLPVVNDKQKSNPTKEFDVLMKLILQSDDELLHVTLYSWLLSEPIKMIDKLLDIKSKYIEDFLNYTATLQQDSTQILDLLWHYYEKNKNYIAAAKILDQLAQRESTNSALKDRLEYISRAIVCAKSTGTLTKISGEGEFLHELEEKMEVARIQLSILDAVKDLPQTIHTSEAITILNSKLMDLSQLYEDFAEPFNLSHCKLAIIHCAGHYDPMLIESLWREIIEQELQSTLESDHDTRMHSIKGLLIHMGKIYSQNERYFPLVYLIKLLEQHGCELGWKPGFIPEVFQLLGVSYSTLFSHYNNLFVEKDSIWTSIGHPLHILSVQLTLLNDYMKIASSYEISSIKCAIDQYLCDLQTLDKSTPDLVQLTAGYRNLKRALNV